MKSRVFGLILAPLLSWAAQYQVLPVEGGGDDALHSAVGALVRNAVVEAGDTPVDSTALKVRTSLIQLGQSYTVIVEVSEDGRVKNSSQMKASSAEELDVVVKRAVLGAIKGSNTSEQASIGKISKEEQQEVVTRKETRGYQSFGLGPAWMFKMRPEGKVSYALHQNRLWEVHPHAAINILTDAAFNFSDMATHDNILIGGRFYLTSTAFSPYLGAGFGFGIAGDRTNHFTYGFDAGGQTGLVLFRTSGTQLEIYCDYDVIFAEGGKHKLATGIAINY